MRVYLYLIAGIISALLGWNIGQFFQTDLGILKQFSEITLFPCIAISLAIGMVMNEIFISNPTRPKMNFRTARIPLLIALGLGMGFGLLAGGISQILFLPQINFPTPVVRIIGWLLIGASVGLAEGLTWRWRSVAAGDAKRFKRRLKISVIGASIASLFAAGIFELLRIFVLEASNNLERVSNLRPIEDPIGFSILGLLLGLFFSISNSPSYVVALRAGAGFEYTGQIYGDEFDQGYDSPNTFQNQSYAYIQQPILRFISNSQQNQIEEGLSIQLPPKGTIRIGSAGKAQISIPGLPLHSADLELKHREAILYPNPKYYNTIEVNGNRLGSNRSILLRHNYLLTFHPKEEDEFNYEKIYRFVYYNRFLDPQA
ncbi:MAG: hypothetical protein QNJ18_02270 [Xenococcaceae cyanobacterium MO_167.B52]|nr:hypothetical protein [Xenococcaceae cyanobacterium MO_167.B52]